MTTGDNKTDPLIDLVAQLTADGDLYTTGVAGLSLFRRSDAEPPHGGFYEPGVCLAIQGRKLVQIGGQELEYDRDRYLLTSLHLPTIVQAIKPCEDKPYLGLAIKFDLQALSQLVLENSLSLKNINHTSLGMATGAMTDELYDAVYRLVKLLTAKRDIATLAPLIKKEIMYRLLFAEQGQRLVEMATSGTHSSQIGKAIHWLKDNFQKTVKVEQLAEFSQMSLSRFHHHFREMTSLTPLQYQKQLRLHEARRLMLADYQDASQAAFAVGYESPSQFSREYSRLYGLSPIKDIAKFRNELGLTAAP